MGKVNKSDRFETLQLHVGREDAADPVMDARAVSKFFNILCIS